MPSSYLSIADVPRLLRADFGVSISYLRLCNLCIEGSIPAKHGHNQRWPVAHRDLKKIAAFIEELEAQKQRAIEERRSSRPRQRVIDPLFAPAGTVFVEE